MRLLGAGVAVSRESELAGAAKARRQQALHGYANGANKPTDLLTIRQAEEQTGVGDATIRRWIRDGKGSRKLPTFRNADDMETTLVSKASVLAWARMKERAPRRLTGRHLTFRLMDSDADALRDLCRLMTVRTGIAMSYVEAVRAAVAGATRLEESRAKAKAEQEAS